jgi:hypothetical protein
LKRRRKNRLPHLPVAERHLAEYNLDGTVIEAEAWRRVSGDLALIERMPTSLECRRDKALANASPTVKASHSS